MNERIAQLVRELFEIVDRVECTEGGRYFHPTELQFSSCRVMDGVRIQTILGEMKYIVGAPPRLTEKELLLKSNSNACLDCMGTGDRYNHELETNECYECGGSGRKEKGAE